MLSGAGNADVNGEYVKKDNSFDSSGTSGLYGVWYNEASASSSTGPFALKIYFNRNAYSIVVERGSVMNDGRFSTTGTPYRIDANISTFDEALALMQNSSNWKYSSGSFDKGALPVPTVEYLPPSGTWKGYKLTKSSSGTWSKASVETANLPVRGADPVVGTIYNEDTTLTISSVLGL